MSGPPIPADAPPEQIIELIERNRHRNPDHHPEGLYDQVLEWVEHPDDRVREAAILFLGRHFQHRSHATALITLLSSDSSEHVRKAAADCLGGVFRATRNRQVCEALASAARNTGESGLVRVAASAAIKRINGY